MRQNGRVTHHCLTDPESGFPRGMPDVGRDGRTGGRDPEGPFEHSCFTCGLVFVWVENCGFVVWTPIESWAIVLEYYKTAPPSSAEVRLDFV